MSIAMAMEMVFRALKEYAFPEPVLPPVEPVEPIEPETPIVEPDPIPPIE